MLEQNQAKINAFQTNLVSWYNEHKRDLPWRTSQDPYRVWVSEVMLQQTRVDTVIPYYERFMRLFPEMEDLAYASEEEILKVWEGLGYYSRVRNLQKGVREVVEHYGGEVPKNRKEIESLKGVGPYTAGAVLSIAYDLPEPAVDGNVMRVLSRVFNLSDDIAKPSTRKKHEAILYEAIYADDPSSFNQGLMELGALVCTPTSPGCLLCPVREQCDAFYLGTQADLPVKSKKKKAKTVDLDAFVLLDENKQLYIEKRPAEGLLAGLWQLPMLPKSQSTKDGQAAISKTYGMNSSLKPLDFHVKHVFSHIIWEIDLYIGHVKQAEMPREWKAVTKHELEQFAFPVSQQKLLSYCLEEELL
ncbi:A/G-specific adenine glycosylase [Bacillus sp. Marseille-P3800]|uniref:A/G-specific adenine glycosylase n=1 Tax=Bacillus sp. Marseille-P3800 TaxID=2014782 RepID=UPI000C075FB8|nr:A/G-specific adenine glycosylase [Bacillus sp. Marseille-P3800]